MSTRVQGPSRSVTLRGYVTAFRGDLNVESVAHRETDCLYMTDPRDAVTRLLQRVLAGLRRL